MRQPGLANPSLTTQPRRPRVGALANVTRHRAAVNAAFFVPNIGPGEAAILATNGAELVAAT